MASLVETFKKQMKAAKKEYRLKRRELEKALTKLDREYGALFGMADGGGAPKVRRKAGRKYGAVRESVLSVIKASKGIKPKQIVEKTGLASQQVHNSLTGLKVAKLVKVKDGIYTAA